MTQEQRHVIAYVLVTLAAVVGYWKLNTIQHDQATASRHRANDLCAIATSDREVVRVLVDAATAPVTPPPGSSQEVKDAYAAGNQRSASLRSFADKLLAPINCSLIESGQPIPTPTSVSLPTPSSLGSG